MALQINYFYDYFSKSSMFFFIEIVNGYSAYEFGEFSSLESITTWSITGIWAFSKEYEY